MVHAYVLLFVWTTFFTGNPWGNPNLHRARILSNLMDNTQRE